MVKGFFTLSDLERMRYQVENHKSLLNIEINTKITDISKSIENVKRILEHLQQGHRKALIIMATGTGKTRVSMAIIDALLKNDWAQKILFLADRRALRDQAWNDGYKVNFPNEAKSKILSGKFEKDKRLYVSTIQTFMDIYNQKDENGRYLISPGEFDVIISDEAHRSIYNKWRDVFTYLDAIQIGLTATPADYIDRNTFYFFNCREGYPTAMYDYYEAVEDGVLVDFRKHVFGAQTHFQIEGVKEKDLSPEEKSELIRQGLNEEEVDFEGTDIEKKIVVTGTNEAIVREFMDNCVMDITGNLPAKSIFFAITKKHAKRLLEAFDKLYPEYHGRLAKVIISEDSRAQDLIKEFKTSSFPRIAVSVDMLDTGIDVPEVCNLVFAKPLRSKIKIWQMIGRGTRSNDACDHLEWLPNGKKEYFKIFDFWKNFEFFDMKPDGDHKESSEAITTRTFLIRLQQMNKLNQMNDIKGFEEMKTKVLEDIESLPKDSISVKDRIREIERSLSPQIWDNVGIDSMDFMKEKIAPLMRFKPEVNPKSASFTLFFEKLSLAILENNTKEFERMQQKIAEYLNCLPITLDVVKEKKELLDKVVSHKFWNEISFEDSKMLITEFAELMKYKTDEPTIQYIFNMDDYIQDIKFIQIGPDMQEEYVDVYKKKVEEKIKELAENHPTIMKIKNGDVLVEQDLEDLESTLYNPELWISEENLRKVYYQSKGTLVLFIKKILGLYKFPDPAEKIKETFQTHIMEYNLQYDSRQLNFIRTIQTVFLAKKHIEFDDLWDPPFTNFGLNAATNLFSDEELVGFIRMCNDLEIELFEVEA